MSSETPIMTMLDTIRQTVKQAEADGMPNAEKWSVLGTLIDQAGVSNHATNVVDGDADGRATLNRNRTADADSVDVDELEFHERHAEKKEASAYPTSRMVTVTPSYSLGKVSDTAVTVDAPSTAASVAASSDSPQSKRTDHGADGTREPKWRSILIGGPGPPPEIFASVSSRTTSFTPKKPMHPSVQSPAGSPSSESPKNRRELEKQREKQARAERKAARKLEKAARRREGISGGEPSTTPQLGSTSKKNTPLTVDAVDATTAEEASEPPAAASEEHLQPNEVLAEPIQKPQSNGVGTSAPTGTPAQRISPRSVAKAAAVVAATLERSTPDRSTPGSDDSPRQNSRLAQVIAAKRAGSTNLKVDTTTSERTSPGTPMSVDDAEVANDSDAPESSRKKRKVSKRAPGYVYIEEYIVPPPSPFDEITSQLAPGRRHTRLATTAVAGTLQTPPCQQCAASSTDCLRRPVEVPLSRRLQLAAPAAEGQALHPVDYEFSGACERCTRVGGARSCSFVRTVSGTDTITGESGYGGTSSKRKYERKADTTAKRAKLRDSGVGTASPTASFEDSREQSAEVGPSRRRSSTFASASRVHETVSPAPPAPTSPGARPGPAASIPAVATAETQDNASSASSPGAHWSAASAGKAASPQFAQKASEPSMPRLIVAEPSITATANGPSGHRTALAGQSNRSTTKPSPSQTAAAKTQPTQSRQSVPPTNKPLTTQPSTAPGDSKPEHPSVASGNSSVKGLHRGPYDSANSTSPALSVRPLHVPKTAFVPIPPSPAARAVARNEINVSCAAPSTALAAGVSRPTPLGTPPLQMPQRATKPGGVVAGPAASVARQTAARAQPPKSAPSVNQAAASSSVSTATRPAPTAVSTPASKTSLSVVNGAKAAEASTVDKIPDQSIPDVSATLFRLVETYLAVCYSSIQDKQDKHRETCGALALSWKHRAEREWQSKRADYRQEMQALVKEINDQIKQMIGDSPVFLLDYLRKRAEEDTQSLEKALID